MDIDDDKQIHVIDYDEMADYELRSTIKIKSIADIAERIKGLKAEEDTDEERVNKK